MRLLLIFALILHSAITFWSLRDVGFFAPFPPFSEDYVYQIFSDLGATLLIAILLMYSKVRLQEKSMRWFLVMLIMIPLVGSFSPLCYLILNPELLSDKKEVSK